jgi:hypothetical protein
MDGHADRRFEPVREAFAGVIAAQSGTGAALAAWADGSWVVEDALRGCLGLPPLAV